MVVDDAVAALRSKRIMGTIQKTAVLTLMLVASSRCPALVLMEVVSKERAERDFGATIRTEVVGTNEVGVWLQFAPKGKLKTFSSVQLEITSGERRLVSATLKPIKQTPDTVVVYFSTDPAYLFSSRLTVFYRIPSGETPYDGIQFNVADFIRQKSSH